MTIQVASPADGDADQSDNEQHHYRDHERNHRIALLFYGLQRIGNIEQWSCGRFNLCTCNEGEVIVIDCHPEGFFRGLRVCEVVKGELSFYDDGCGGDFDRDVGCAWEFHQQIRDELDLVKSFDGTSYGEGCGHHGS